jgi:hypothetical protein
MNLGSTLKQESSFNDCNPLLETRSCKDLSILLDFEYDSINILNMQQKAFENTIKSGEG